MCPSLCALGPVVVVFTSVAVPGWTRVKFRTKNDSMKDGETAALVFKAPPGASITISHFEEASGAEQGAATALAFGVNARIDSRKIVMRKHLISGRFPLYMFFLDLCKSLKVFKD